MKDKMNINLKCETYEFYGQRQNNTKKGQKGMTNIQLSENRHHELLLWQFHIYKHTQNIKYLQPTTTDSEKHL